MTITTIKKQVKLATFIGLALGSTFSLFSLNTLAGTSTANPKATATISAVCNISAQNLGFGSLVLPIASQSANSSMNVLCSKNAPYTIALAYGGVYGTGSSAVVDASLVQFAAASAYPGSTDSTYNSQMSSLKLWRVWNPGGEPSVIRSIQYYEYNAAGVQVGVVAINATASNPNALPTGSSTSDTGVKVNNVYTFGGYTYGKMIGVVSGDTVAYSIAVPGNPGQVWNAGAYSYTSTGTGATQSIPVIGTLVPSQTGAYPTPDYYMDTVTATVSF